MHPRVASPGPNSDDPKERVYGRTGPVSVSQSQNRVEQSQRVLIMMPFTTYRPITCLNTAFKLFTGALTGMLLDHTTAYNCLPPEQKALRKGRRGEKLNLRIPKTLKAAGLVKPGVVGGGRVTLLIDQVVPTDRQVTENRPDLIVRLREERRIVGMEVACAWDPLVVEREQEKRQKYTRLKADLAR